MAYEYSNVNEKKEDSKIIIEISLLIEHLHFVTGFLREGVGRIDRGGSLAARENRGAADG